MVIGYKKVAMMLILHLDEVPESAEIVPQVKVSGRPDAADNCFHGAKVVKKVSSRQSAVFGLKLENGNWKFGAAVSASQASAHFYVVMKDILQYKFLLRNIRKVILPGGTVKGDKINCCCEIRI